MTGIDPEHVQLKRCAVAGAAVPAHPAYRQFRHHEDVDRERDIAWLNLKVQGTRYIQAKDIESRVVGLNLRAKAENIAGLQLADLVVSPIGRNDYRENFLKL